MTISTIVVAVTSEESEGKRIHNGRLFVDSGDGLGGPVGVFTCEEVSSGLVNCTATNDSATTSALDTSSSEIVSGLNKDTLGNTSDGTPNANSVLEAA